MTLKLPPKVSNEVAAGVSELYLRFNCDYCQEVQNYLRFCFMINYNNALLLHPLKATINSIELIRVQVNTYTTFYSQSYKTFSSFSD